MNPISQAEGTQKNGDRRSSSHLGPKGDETEEEYDAFAKPRKVQYKNKWAISQDAIYWKKDKLKGSSSGRSDLMPSSFMTQCQLTALKKW